MEDGREFTTCFVFGSDGHPIGHGVETPVATVPAVPGASLGHWKETCPGRSMRRAPTCTFRASQSFVIWHSSPLLHKSMACFIKNSPYRVGTCSCSAVNQRSTCSWTQSQPHDQLSYDMLAICQLLAESLAESHRCCKSALRHGVFGIQSRT